MVQKSLDLKNKCAHQSKYTCFCPLPTIAITPGWGQVEQHAAEKLQEAQVEIK